MTDEEVRHLLDVIYHRFHYDFRDYAFPSIRRRVEAALWKLGFRDLGSLEQALFVRPATFTALLRYLTVHVSDLFRDPPFFRLFRTHVVPELETYPSLRIWVAGCSTGEEAFSVAIVLREEGLLERALIYATDIHPEALAVGEAGIFPADRFAGFGENYRLAGGKGSLAEHYTAAHGSAVFDKGLRKRILFADHSLATDGVFAEAHAVFCRNVLIYFDRSLRARALSLMHEALCRRGFFGLGSQETLQSPEEGSMFVGFDVGSRWYQKR